MISWICSYCSKVVSVEVEPRPAVPVFDEPIPEGWAWKKYDSARCPGRDTRALGCCPEHAELAAAKFRIPPEAKPIGFEE